jgi:hypothetical protein
MKSRSQRAVCFLLTCRQPGIDLIYEPTTVFERALSLDFLEHDCTPIPQGSALPYPVVKGNSDFLDAYLA